MFQSPLQATQANFLFMLNHGSNQLFIFPLIEISGPPKGPPHAQEGIFHFQVSLGDVLSTLTKFHQNLTTSISAEWSGDSWINCLQLYSLAIIIILYRLPLMKINLFVSSACLKRSQYIYFFVRQTEMKVQDTRILISIISQIVKITTGIKR